MSNLSDATLQGGVSQTYGPESGRAAVALSKSVADQLALLNTVPGFDMKIFLSSLLQIIETPVINQQPAVLASAQPLSPILPPYQAYPFGERQITDIPPMRSDVGSKEAIRDTAEAKKSPPKCEPENERTWRDDTFKTGTRQSDITASITHSIESIMHELRNNLGPEDRIELLHASSGIEKAKKLLTIADSSDGNPVFIQAFQAALRNQSNIQYILKGH